MRSATSTNVNELPLIDIVALDVKGQLDDKTAGLLRQPQFFDMWEQELLTLQARCKVQLEGIRVELADLESTWLTTADADETRYLTAKNLILRSRYDVTRFLNGVNERLAESRKLAGRPNPEQAARQAEIEARKLRVQEKQEERKLRSQDHRLLVANQHTVKLEKQVAGLQYAVRQAHEANRQSRRATERYKIWAQKLHDACFMLRTLEGAKGTEANLDLIRILDEALRKPPIEDEETAGAALDTPAQSE